MTFLVPGWQNLLQHKQFPRASHGTKIAGVGLCAVVVVGRVVLVEVQAATCYVIAHKIRMVAYLTQRCDCSERLRTAREYCCHLHTSRKINADRA